MPCRRELRAELETMRNNRARDAQQTRTAETILVGERGEPISPITLAAAVRAQLKRMGAGGYSIHGLRKNAAVALADAGCTDFEVASITGHTTLAMVQHYTKHRDQRLHARAAMDKWERKTDKRSRGTLT
jgi:integrase